MNILVTGACGFIGSKVANSLSDFAEITTIDNCTTGSINNLPTNTIFIEGDCQSSITIEKLEDKEFDIIMHIAGQSSGEISFEDPIYDLQTNTQSTLMLLDYALKHRCKKFVFASTMSVYGDGHTDAVSEQSELNPKSFYAIGKIASENYLKLYASYGLQTTSLRLFNVYGPGQNLENMKQGMLSIYLSQLIKSGKIVVKGSPNRFRDFIHVKDVVNAFKRIVSYDENGYSCFNIGTGRSWMIQDVLNMLIDIYGKEFPIKYVDKTPGDMEGVFANITKAVSLLNWQPYIEFKDGFANFVSWGLDKNVH